MDIRLTSMDKVEIAGNRRKLNLFPSIVTISRENYCHGLPTNLFILSWTAPTFTDTTSTFRFSRGLRPYFHGHPPYFHGQGRNSRK
ncbi:hypothetical protein CLOP_g22277 [Closterium sp. NIES-67]|nr:hypothetical protein CLOP_g22277 [Closterium sp. NIES-67]